MPKRYPLYELSLKLYPKQFQRRYAHQMVQTMADMLEDQPHTAARMALWIRTGCNLAITIVQENITSLGGTMTNKPLKSYFSYKRLAVVLAGIILLMIGAFHSRIQANAASLVVRPFYMHGVTSTLEKQNEVLHDPMTQLYGSVPEAKNSCTSQLVQGIHTQVGCQSTMQAYTKLAQGDAGKQAAQAKVQAIETALKANGYTAGGNGVTLTSLVMGTYEGKDYSADAFYEKVIGQYDCVFDTMIAYGNPEQPAITTSFWCTRTVNVLGAPSHTFYRSDKGMMGN